MIPRKNTPKALAWLNYNLNLDAQTCVMGILNVTPDSFFDGGLHFHKNDAVESGIRMAVDGADVIDVGGESTRPFSEPVPLDEELRRVIPVIKTLSREIDIPISIDTYKSEVARQALEVGASIINDVSALRFDAAMGPLAANVGVPVILMHMKGTPRNMQVNPIYTDLIGEIIGFLSTAVERATKMGISKEHIIIDPGIGFGKSFDDNLKILSCLHRFTTLGQPLLVGTSNKAFIGNVLDLTVESRATGTMATIAAAAMNGANIIRAHHVKPAKETVTIIDAIKSGCSDLES